MSAPASPLSSPLSPPRWLLVGVLVLGALAFLPSLGGGFLGDDFVYIARFQKLPWSEWPALFTRDWSDGIWGQQLRELRPFAALSLMGDARLFGGSALGYRLTNLALHLFATFLVVRLAWRYTNASVAGTLAAGLIFALHPAHAEAVSWITGRVDVQATAAALLFWFAAEVYSLRGHAGRLTLALLAFFIGVFSKELCLFAPLLLLLRWLLLDFRAEKRVWLRRAAVLAGVVVLITVYGACRRAAFGHDNIGYSLWSDGGAWERQTSYVGWLAPVLPLRGWAEWRSFPATGTAHIVWMTMLAFTVVGLAVSLWRRAPLAAGFFFFGGVWYFVSVGTLTGVSYFSPRHLYFPTIGLALAAGCLCAALRWRHALATILVAWCAVAHFAALRPWQHAGAVSRDALATLDREFASAPAGTLALTAVPERLGHAWLWAWSSPANIQPPFVAHPPAKIVERVANYYRVESWGPDHQPLETLRAARDAIALFVADDGRIACRRIAPDALAAAVAKLGNGVPSPEAWSAWVRALAEP